MHRVAVLAFDGVVAFDLAVPCEGLSRVRLPSGRPGYQCAGRAKRLTHTGLLDGRRATTHWLACTELARRYPRIHVDPGVLYVDEGSLLTSAGAAAGLDLCLHLVRKDYGSALAAEAARYAVMPLERAGGQSQFIAHPEPDTDGGSLSALLDWLEAHLHEPLDAKRVAAQIGMSPRSLSRRFTEQGGTSLLQWLLRARVRRAQLLLETTDLPVERVADHVGFGTAAALRDRFRRELRTSPQSYRRAFRGVAGR